MPTQSYFKSKCKKHNMTYTLYCKITFWSKARIYWLPNSSFSERISNAKARNFPFKPAFAQNHRSSGCVNAECAELFSSGEKIRFQRVGGFYNNRNGG